MTQVNNDKSQFYYMGGLAGIGVGIFILTFAITNELIGGLFSKEALFGEPITPWIERIIAHPKLALFVIPLPIIGFTCMMITSFSVYQILPRKSWSMTISLIGFLIGIPVALTNFLSVWSLVRLITFDPQKSAEFTQLAAVEMNQFMILNFFIGPFFIIFIGETLLAYSALKQKFFPKWLCFWAIINGIITFIGFFTLLFPPLAITSIAGPSTMLWFVVVGITLLRRAKSLEDEK